MAKCLYCYKELSEGEIDYHKSCCRKIFGTTEVPLFEYTRKNIRDLATKIIKSQTTLTGVQAKLSLDITKGGKNEPTKFTIIGLYGRFILKPQTEYYSHLPELEDLTMHLAELAKIKVVPHALIRFTDGELCYITRRIDRTTTGEKLAMEDMCQLSERLTEHKYKGSYEQIAKIIKKYSSAPALDLVNFWEQVLFSWITGNSDMHLKNFSMYSLLKGQYMLTPAYDLLSTVLVMPEDTEELALTLGGKKKKLTIQLFKNAMLDSGLEEKVIHNILKKFNRAFPLWLDFIDLSFLPEEMKCAYKKRISDYMQKILLTTQWLIS